MEFIVFPDSYAGAVFNATMPRLPYVRRIYYEMMEQSTCSLPTPAQEEAYQDALSHVANALSKRAQKVHGSLKKFGAVPSSAGLHACTSSSSNDSTTKSRKECLKDAFDFLTCLERNRLYDPPPDDEIQYYLLIKKYTRSMINFFDAWNLAFTPEYCLPKWSDTCYHRRYECLTSCYSLEHLEDIEALGEHFADITKCVLDLDINNCNLIKPSMSMGTKDSTETPESMVRRSRENSSLFYWHKFFLAALDLRSSELAFAPPEEDERLSYQRVLDVFDRGGNRPEDKIDIYSEELRSLYFERIYDGYSNLERHFKTTAKALLEKLHIADCLDSVLERADCYDTFICLGKKLAEGCEKSVLNLPGYIGDVNRCIQIAFMIRLLVLGRSSQHHDVIDFMEKTNFPNKKKKIAWAALHAVSLSKVGMGCCSDYPDKGNLLVFRDSPEQARRNIRYLGRAESENKNLKILRRIVRDLRRMGESAMEPDQEERQLMNKIWQKATLSAHFFTSVTAFQQKRQVVQHGGFHDVNFLRLRSGNSKKSHITGEDVRQKFQILRKDICNFVETLEGYVLYMHRSSNPKQAEGRRIN